MTDTSPTITRRPHFRRHDPQPFVIQDDDIAIVRFVYEGRFRRSTDICKFMSHRPAKKILERLAVLYHNGALDRPAAQRDYFSANKRRPAYIYAIGSRGAALLAEVDGIEMPKTDWSRAKNGARPTLHPPSPSDLRRTHRVQNGDQTAPRSQIYRTFRNSQPRARPPPSNSPTPGSGRPRCQHQTASSSTRRMCLMPPSASISFRSEQDFSTCWRPTERPCPCGASTFSKTSLLRKISHLLPRTQGRLSQPHLQHPKFQSADRAPRSPERATNTIAMIKKHIAPTNMFLFTDVASLQNARDVLALAWTTAKGEHVRLAD